MSGELTLPPNAIRPQYDSAGFASIPQTISYLLTGQGDPALPPDLFSGLPQQYERVILFFIDSFGWRFFETFQDRSVFLKAIVKDGRTAKLISQFPSTTAAHVTCIHTGLSSGQSGVYEWRYYEPQLDALIAPLLFSFAGDSERDTLAPTGIRPEMLYPTETIYTTLQQNGVSSYAFQQREIARTPYSDLMFSGAEIRPYKTLPEALVNVSLLLVGRST